jgi:hypothetical protein
MRYRLASMMTRSWCPFGQILLLVGILVGLTPTAAVASFPGGDGVIAYSAAHTSQPGIWAVDPATGNQLRLTSGANDADPSFSASGNMLAFQRRERGVLAIYVARADGSNATRLVSGSEPAFSPDGRQIAFVRPTGLFLIGLAPNSRAYQITNHRGDRRPMWSYTGEIVFQRTDISQELYRGERLGSVQEELDTITPPSSRVHQVLTYDQDGELWPEWSPDGKALALDLCKDREPFPPPRGLPVTVPSFKFGPSCLPQVWAPDGRRLVEPAERLKAHGWGEPETSCPRYIPKEEDPFGFYETTPSGQDIREPESPVEISWQPLVNGAMQLHTTPCEARKQPGFTYGEGGVGAPPVEPGARVCVKPRRRGHSHKLMCRG